MTDQSPYTPSLAELRAFAGDHFCTNPEDPSHERDICPGDLAFDRLIAQVRAEAVEKDRARIRSTIGAFVDEGVWAFDAAISTLEKKPNPHREGQ